MTTKASVLAMATVLAQAGLSKESWGNVSSLVEDWLRATQTSEDDVRPVAAAHVGLLPRS